VTRQAGGPWLWSLGLHALAVAVAGVFLVQLPVGGPQAVQMRLVGVSRPAEASAPVSGAWWPGAPAPEVPRSEPAAPSWRGSATAAPSAPAGVSVPVSLEELLAGTVSEPVSPPEALGSSQGWVAAGAEGYQVPPLPPPGLAPPQGARWALVLSIPGTGGFLSAVDGVDSGHPDLDRWLETYLRSVSFPASLDGREYRLHWTLRLESGRPR